MNNSTNECIVNIWINERCVERHNIIDVDGITPFAPSTLVDLYFDYREWMEYEYDDHWKSVDKKKFRNALLKWQENSKWGLTIGKNKADFKVNGYTLKPLFNLALYGWAWDTDTGEENPNLIY